jgi:hypothetical protein
LPGSVSDIQRDLAPEVNRLRSAGPFTAPFVCQLSF